MADWYYLKNGEQQGPVTKEAIQDLLQSRQLQRADLVWTDGMKDWLPAQSVAELGLAPGLPPPPARAVPVGDPPAQAVPNYLVWSIISNLCCFPPTGIVALIYSAKTATAMDLGNLGKAQEYSKKAKTWNLVSLGVGIILFIVNVVSLVCTLIPMMQMVMQNMPAGQ